MEYLASLVNFTDSGGFHRYPEPQISQITQIDLKPTLLEFVTGMKPISKIRGIYVISVICG